MATKHNSQCLQKAADNEPIFVLRATDLSAPFIVRSWANRNKASISPEKYQDAMNVAGAMEKWPNRKKPD